MKTRAGNWTAATVTVLLALTSPVAHAQPDYSHEEQLECRVTNFFKSCSRSINSAPHDALGIAGTVVATKRLSRWRTRLQVEVVRATAPVGKSVEVDVTACNMWQGRVGDQITAIVYVEVDPRHGAYQLHPSCNT